MFEQQHHQINSGSLTLHAWTDGNPEATPLVMVHGYPDNHRVWDQVTDALRDDFLVIRYDVRGAGLSDKPKRTRDYRLALLADDLTAVVDALIPRRPFHLVAHDWGSIQSWESVTGGPLQHRIRSFSTISGPCLDHIGFLIRDQVSGATQISTRQLLSQLASSWYVGFFQLPVVPETLWRAGLDRLWPRYLQRREQVSDARFSDLQKADGQYGVKLYRANVLPRLLKPRRRYAQCPVQMVIPTQDAYVKPHLTEQTVRWTGKLTRQRLDAPHWAPLTQPHAIAGAVRHFVQAHA